MIAIDRHPFRLVEHSGFRRFMAKHFPRYTVPSADHISRVVMPELYSEVRQPVEALLHEAKFVAVTTDGWTTASGTFEVFALIVTFLNDEFKMRQITLCTPEVQGSPTGESIAAILQEALEEWQIGSKVAAFVSNNAANVQKAIRLLQIKRLPCVLHALQNSIC